jgi:hypothetical protein
MASFIEIRSFANSMADLDQNKSRRWIDRTVRKSIFFRVLGASLYLLAVALALPVGAQIADTDASAVAASASTASLIRWTGSLSPAAGRTVEMSFSLYQNPAGGPALWSETQPVKVGTDGRYSVLLGATSAEGLPQTLFQAGEARWIEARPVVAQLSTTSGGDTMVESDSMQPLVRRLLSAVPYAFKSVDADSLAGRPAADYVTREDLQSTVASQVLAIPSTRSTRSNVTNPLPIVGTPLPILGSSSSSSSSSFGGGTVLNGTGTSGFLPAWTASATLGNSMIAESGTNVGIGTSAPATLLDVNGSSTLRGMVSLLATTATLAAGANSPAFQLSASTYSSTSNAAVPQNFVWQAASAGNNTATPSANLNLLFGAGDATPAATGLSIAPSGQITFASGQTFPSVSSGTGSSAITAVTAGPGLTGGGSTGNVTLALSGPISTANGGTGATTPASGRTNLGAAASGVNADISSLSGLTTALSVAQGGTGSQSSAGALANLTSAIYVDGVKYPKTAAGIQQALNDAPLGGTVYLPTGVYTYGTSDTCITVTRPVSVLGMGKGSVIQVASYVSASNDIFCVNPTTDGHFIRFADFSILPVSGAPARYAFNLNGATSDIESLSIERINIKKSLGSYAIYAQGSGQGNGVPALTNIQYNFLAGGIVMPNAGDTVRIMDNIITASGKIDISFQPGASSLIFARNNVTVPGGMHIGTCANATHIEDNEFETAPGFTGSNGSVIDIDGVNGTNQNPAQSTILERNSLQVVSGITAIGIRVNRANNTYISGNSFERGATKSTDIFITNNATGTIVGVNMWLHGLPYSSMVSNSGTGTSFLTQYSSLNNVASSATTSPFSTATSVSARQGATTQSDSTSNMNEMTFSGLVGVSGSECKLTDITGNSLTGSIRSGTTGICTLTITPGFTATHGFSCFVNDETTADTFRQTAHTTTNAILSGATLAGDVLTFGCQPF